MERKLDLQQEKKDASGFHRERKIKQKQNNNIINFIKKKRNLTCTKKIRIPKGFTRREPVKEIM